MRKAGVYVVAESVKGIVTRFVSANREERKERIRGTGGSHKPNNDRLEVGPGHDLLAFGIWCVELDSDTQTADSHRSLCAETFDGLHETPSGHGPELDLVLVHHGRPTDDAPSVIEALHDRQPVPNGNDKFVRKDRIEELSDLSSVGL